eukprot:Opistho-2@35060
MRATSAVDSPKCIILSAYSRINFTLLAKLAVLDRRMATILGAVPHRLRAHMSLAIGLGIGAVIVWIASASLGLQAARLSVKSDEIDSSQYLSRSVQPDSAMNTAELQSVGADLTLSGRDDIEGGVLLDDQEAEPYIPPLPLKWTTAWRDAFEYCEKGAACISAGTTDPKRTHFIGLRRYAAAGVKAGEVIEFGIRTRDADGNPRMCGGDSFQVELRGPSIYAGHAIDNMDGTYSFRAKLLDAGVYRVYARLDFRGCEGLTGCHIWKTTRILIAWIGDGETELAPSIAVRNAAVFHMGGCGVRYSPSLSFDDPTLRIGRWRGANLACADAQFPALPVTKCKPYPKAPFLWHPLEIARPFMPVRDLRDVWIHIIGDSLDRNSHIFFEKYLPSQLPGPFRRACYRVLGIPPRNETLPFVVNDECTGGLFIPPLPMYLEFLRMITFPTVNVTISYMMFNEHFAARSKYSPPHNGSFSPWTDTAFLDKMKATAFPSDIPAEKMGAPVSEFDPVFSRNRAAVPTHVILNVGLHFVFPLPALLGYPAFLGAVVAQVKRDFPPPKTRLIWRSTAQTQYQNTTLPSFHTCRTTYRVAFVNEVAASIISREGIPVVDYLQFSLGRADAAPDNRHYMESVQNEVVSELFNIIQDCSAAVRK